MTFQAFEQSLAVRWPVALWRDVTVLAAVSGGSDSLALLRAMTALKREAGGAGQLRAAHFNHKLRGAESDQDEQFVVDLCRRLDVPCDVGAAAVDSAPLPAETGEAAARAARYQFLQATAENLGARYVVTAHTADDQAETILHRIVRGTGLAGLGGMRRARPLGPAVTLIRPLLEIRRAEVLAYLATLGQESRDDSSNCDVRFTRNRIRNELLPLLARDHNPSVTEALLRLGSLAAEAQETIGDRVRELYERCVRMAGDGMVAINCDPLAPERPNLVRELLIHVWREQRWPEQAMGFAEWSLLAEMILGHPPSVVAQTFPGGVRAQRTNEQLTLIRYASTGPVTPPVYSSS